MTEPLFNDVLQVGIVVRDLDAAMKTYVEDYGIGPWSILEINPDTAEDLCQNEEPAPYAMRVALATIGSVQWELIEPKDDGTPYAEFLRTHGEGLHHVAFGVESYGAAVDRLRARGHRILMSGRHQGAAWAYLSTDQELGFPVELFDLPEGLQQTPHAVYPPPAEPDS